MNNLKGNIIKLGEELQDVGINGSPLGVDAIEKLFSYDPINRLRSATGRESNSQTNSDFWNEKPIAGNPNAQNTRAYTRSYDYDKVGNIKTLKHQATGFNFTRKYNYISGVNQLLNIDNNQSTPSIHAAYTYDEVGNQTQVNTERYYEWDVADQLKYFKIQAGATPSLQAQYHYAGGERIKKETKDQAGNTEVTIYIDGFVEHRYKKNNTGTITEEQNVIHIMDGRSRVATIRTGDDFGDTTPAIKYNLEDHLGTSTVRLDANGDLIDREEYYPFGDSSLRTTSFKRYRYVGKEKDSESGLYYYGARYYSAWTCRFVSVDPLAAKYKQLTPYNYSANDPIGDLDIDGMQSTKVEGDELPPDVKNNENKKSGSTDGKYDTEVRKKGARVTEDFSSEINMLPTNSFDGKKVSFTYTEGDVSSVDWIYDYKSDSWSFTENYRDGFRFKSDNLAYTYNANSSGRNLNQERKDEIKAEKVAAEVEKNMLKEEQQELSYSMLNEQTEEIQKYTGPTLSEYVEPLNVPENKEEVPVRFLLSAVAYLTQAISSQVEKGLRWAAEKTKQNAKSFFGKLTKSGRAAMEKADYLLKQAKFAKVLARRVGFLGIGLSIIDMIIGQGDFNERFQRNGIDILVGFVSGFVPIIGVGYFVGQLSGWW